MTNITTLATRARILRGIREFFWLRGLLEVETPVLLAHPSQEPELEPLTTVLRDHRGNPHEGFLRMSPEFSIKKILGAVADLQPAVAGCFEIGPVFRDGEPWGGQHNPEFTMLEFYELGKDYHALMDTCEDLVRALCAPQPAPHLAAPWERLTMRAAWERYANLDLAALLHRDVMAAACRARGYTVVDDDTFDDCFFRIFLTDIEPQLGRERPTFVYDWPMQMAALAKTRGDDPRWAERVELYSGGLELANGFTELTDSVEQRARFVCDRAQRRAMGRTPHPIDEAFLAALDTIPPVAGMAVGVDRIVMLLTGAPSIDAVRWLPASELWSG
ncbi:MAG: EF-P lysine aminoacylase EpmA [bacterium]|nr:EF-P lysine aminoacylase EpmA [bacterium]